MSDHAAIGVTRAVIYARCSTSEQDFSRQLQELRASARNAGWAVVAQIGSYASGSLNDHDLNQIRSMASHRMFDVLMVWELSRLSRRGPGSILAILTQLEAWGVRVDSQVETWLNVDGPQRELLISIFGWVARWEREMISQRTRSGMASRRALGIHLGRPKGARDRSPRKARAKRGTLRSVEERNLTNKGPLFGGTG